MYLSKLEIIGFKSFAQKVNLTFDSGISAIVGPNGCGKTNIVDAIRWVLGEQRYSALRSEKMEDVIFNGTKSRKPLGMAEASLVIENTKGILPSEYSQVTVTRRVYRSGESEYLLNKVPCRLKDILDLFMDTGMGADAYSVIELKMVETILSDKADERRRLFEEAAGVTKYKHRRKAAYRKLESVQADLVRVNDIVSEVQKSVSTLERQAKKAGQFNEVRSKLKSMEIDLMEREYAHLFGRIAPLEERLAALSVDKDKIDTDLSNEEGLHETLQGSLADLERKLSEAQRDVNAQVEKIRQVEQKNLIAGERIKGLRDNIERFELEKKELHEQHESLEAMKVTLHERIGELTGGVDRASEDLSRAQHELAEYTQRLDAKKADLQSLNDRTIALVHETAEKQAVQDRKKAHVENLHGRAMHASEENASYEQEIIRLNEQITSFSAEDKQLRKLFAEAEIRFYDAEARKKELKEELDELHRKEVEIQTEIERKKARADFLKGLIESKEGLSDGARYLCSVAEWRSSRKLTVADAISAEEKCRPAIEAALGDFAGCLIVDSAEEAEEGISLLKRGQRGKATFVVLNRIPEIRSRHRLPKMPGVIGWAATLANFDLVYAPLFRLILDRVLVVDSPVTATKVAESLSGIRCVTLEGEIATGIGLKRGGSKRYDEGGAIGKQAQVEEIQKEIEQLAVQIEASRTSQKETVSAYDSINLKERADQVKQLEKEMSAVEMRIAQLEFEKKRAGDIISRNLEEIQSLSGEAEVLTSEIVTAAPELEAVKNEKTDIERRVGGATKELESIEAEWNERSRRVHDLGIAMVTLRSDLQTARNDLKRAEATISDILTTVDRRNEDIGRAHADVALANAGIEETNVVLEQMRVDLAVLEEQKASIEQETLRVRQEIHRIELKIKDERRHHDDSLKAVHDLELKIADLKAKAEHIRARALEEYELAIELKDYPDNEFVDFAALREEIQVLRDRMKSLGNINFAAFEEYNTEKERYEFLSAQRKDLLEAEKTLLSTIEEINATAQKKFLDTFDKIRVNFIETFKSLFDPGDECDLKLEEDVDPLEAKIEIVAKPRGKRPTSIELLSGGEKTLTATALLFAIYLVKPSPFCILDEVDAPLDDANVDRFTRILRKFSDNTQFIVVTHNKRTMEAANALYGVTMEEEGVSKLVTVRFSRGAEVKSAALVSG